MSGSRRTSSNQPTSMSASEALKGSVSSLTVNFRRTEPAGIRNAAKIIKRFDMINNLVLQGDPDEHLFEGAYSLLSQLSASSEDKSRGPTIHNIDFVLPGSLKIPHTRLPHTPSRRPNENEKMPRLTIRLNEGSHTSDCCPPEVSAEYLANALESLMTMTSGALMDVRHLDGMRRLRDTSIGPHLAQHLSITEEGRKRIADGECLERVSIRRCCCLYDNSFRDIEVRRLALE